MILFLTPPLTQLNTPYPATTALMGWMKELGVEATQRDLSIEVALEVLRRYGEQPLTDEVIAFLQGKSPDEAETLAEPGYLPEGDSFRELEHVGWIEDPQERAKLRCSLYLDDLAAAIRDEIDPDFGFSRYAERLGAAVPDFGIVLKRLRRRSAIDRILEDKTAEALSEVFGKKGGARGNGKGNRPIVSVTCPFPGTLIGAFRIARVVRQMLPEATLVLGGGYVNTELRFMNDPRVKRFFDVVMYDEGYAPWRELVKAQVRTSRQNTPVPPLVRPSYAGLDLSQYIDLAETANPMHRLWSDGRWLKLQLARGCYWHKCAFCDVTLDYIKCFEMPAASALVDAMQELAEEYEGTVPMKTRSIPSFHFTDEAIPPILAEKLAREILQRGFVCRWWGNVRFDTSWTLPRCRLLARAGCIAVTGGLECANDRLLKLMNKGITLDSAKQALGNFAAVGIMVHTYLMYGFPTQTERELEGALKYVRDRFREGVVQSAFFHRFALTVHSPIAREPGKFGIQVDCDEKLPGKRTRRFALNEIGYVEDGAPDWARYKRPLEIALYNYMLGLGLNRSPRFFLKLGR